MDKVLVVDDELSNILVLTDILSRIDGIEIYKAESAKSAMKILLKHDVSCILLDVVMPDVTGMEFLKQLSDMPDYNNIPVIMVTGKVFSKNETLAAYQMGAIDFIVKPLEPSVVFRKVDFIVSSSRRQRLINSLESYLNSIDERVLNPLFTMRDHFKDQGQYSLDDVLSFLCLLNKDWLKLTSKNPVNHFNRIERDAG